MAGNEVTPMILGHLDILLVEDDQAHAEIVRRNFEEMGLPNEITHVADGQAALDYLYRQGVFSDPATSPRPGLILLDLRLPRVDGLVVLSIIKSDPDLLQIPTVVLSTSSAPADKGRAYGSHANSYLVKPMDHARFAAMLETVGDYWLTWNECPL